ncbi:MAG: SRPBCC domain-containing protein [Deltaproteobacteria bacterium]|nr:MAG: SRPBCC domain-containing protein [Deltaproteobacteria bacterium]
MARPARSRRAAVRCSASSAAIACRLHAGGAPAQSMRESPSATPARPGVLIAARSPMIEVTASCDIDASAEAVWTVLTDLEHFQIWNPFIRSAHGSTEVGGTVHVRVQPSLGVLLSFDATVLDREPNRALHWRGHVGAPWLASGDHTFTIEPIGERRVRLIQRETFGGVLPWFARRLVAREARLGFDAMNHALAARVRDAGAAS